MRRRPLLLSTAAWALSGLGAVSWSQGLENDEWRAMVGDVQAMPRQQQLPGANEAIDLRMRYRPDLDDFWQTPFMTLQRRAGDCEDFAIAKYALLRCAGWSDNEVRLAYGRTVAFGVPMNHLVAVEVSGDTTLRVLDNLGDAPRPLSERPDLQLLFAFGESRVWVFDDGRFHPTRQRFTKFEALSRTMRAEGSLPRA